MERRRRHLHLPNPQRRLTGLTRARTDTALPPALTGLTYLFVLVGALLFAYKSAPAAELVMFEQWGCEWCEVWDEEVGTAYPLTKEGRLAPLRRVDIDEDRPTDLAEVRGVRYTPTFVVMDRGREVGRILGYPGEDMFYGLLGEILKKLNKPTS